MHAILQADAIDAPAGQDADTIWEVFASRGMGWFATGTDTEGNPIGLWKTDSSAG